MHRLTASHPSPDGFIPGPRAGQPHGVHSFSAPREEVRENTPALLSTVREYRPLLLSGTPSQYEPTSQFLSWGLLWGASLGL